MNAKCLLPAASVLAEGPVWHDNHLWWVDIERGEFHRLNPATGKDTAWKVPHRVGFMVPSVRGDFVVGTDRGIARFSPADGQLSLLSNPEPDLPGNRFNDAKCDAFGRLWAGTMAVNEAPEQGALYRIDSDLHVHRVVTGVSISNGLAWSADQRTLYYIDSPTRHVDAFDFNLSTGAIGNRRTIIEITDGFPDGMSIDHEGNLWIAIWGGWCVACHNPRTGRRLREVRVPVEDVTSCCFGSGTTLYITTAGRDVTDAERPKQPLAGGIFQADVGVSGPVPGPFAG